MKYGYARVSSDGQGDVLTVTRLDRLARSTRDLLNTLAAITGKKAGFKSLGDTWADTTTSHGRLMLTVLGGLAEFERDLIRARTGEGRARAVARGQKMGRPFKLTDHQKHEAIKRREQGETLADIARSYNVSPATISRLAAWCYYLHLEDIKPNLFMIDCVHEGNGTRSSSMTSQYW
jgi:DNA invertase Pin-like site-specific DNA recombinase